MPMRCSRDVRSAGTVFVGESSSVVFGDYMTGANHVLPTGGLARSYSGLSTLDFVRWTTYQRVDADGAARLSSDVAAFADCRAAPGTRRSGADVEAFDVTRVNAGSVSASLELARATIRDLVPYPTERIPCDADLSDNTNLFGAPPAAMRELATSGRDEITRYPGLYTRRLREALAEYAGVRPEEIVTGCGSDDVIDSAIRAFAEPGESLAYSDPTFSMIPVFAKVNGIVPVPVPFTPSLDIDPDALLATNARVIYVCAPNNPTGTAPSPAAIDRVIERAPGIVILDEAYAEFAGAGRVADGPRHDAAARHANVVEGLRDGRFSHRLRYRVGRPRSRDRKGPGAVQGERTGRTCGGVRGS